MVQGSEVQSFRVQVAGCRVQGPNLQNLKGLKYLLFKIQVSDLKGSGFRASGLLVRVQAAGFKGQAFKLKKG